MYLLSLLSKSLFYGNIMYICIVTIILYDNIHFSRRYFDIEQKEFKKLLFLLFFIFKLYKKSFENITKLQIQFFK